MDKNGVKQSKMDKLGEKLALRHDFVNIGTWGRYMWYLRDSFAKLASTITKDYGDWCKGVDDMLMGTQIGQLGMRNGQVVEFFDQNGQNFGKNGKNGEKLKNLEKSGKIQFRSANHLDFMLNLDQFQTESITSDYYNAVVDGEGRGDGESGLGCGG